jgi:broad specificity phosphatase PhoE
MILYACHPEVVMDPAVPVPRWHLSDAGVRRMRAFAAALQRPDTVWASTECKAIEAAGILAARFGLPVQVHPGLDENDRSSTGYLPPERFQAAADAFFAAPDRSYQGWERAVDAQARVAAAWDGIVEAPGRIVIVGHGGTGTLLMCRLAGLPISRAHDAPRQGCYWAWDPAAGQLVHGWRALEIM